MPRQTPKRPQDYVRCAAPWCRRLIEKKNVKIFNGLPYGADCYQKAVNNAMAEAEGTRSP